MRKCLFFICLTAFLTVTVFAQSDNANLQKTADLLVSAYNAKNYAQIEQQFNEQMKAAVSGDQLKVFLDSVHKDFGKITTLGKPQNNSPVSAIFPADFERGNMDLFIALDSAGKIAGFRISPPKPERTANISRNKTKMNLPFKGEWLVFWGGDTVSQNYHQDAPNQRFAFDIVKVDESGKTHRGDGRKNEDYYAFGQEIIAPADGVVSYVVDGIHDNVPGEMNKMYVPGNLVIIKHADGEYSLFAHFKQNSIRVKIGDKVIKGQTLGLCGNSGNSSEAHLHFQVQSAPFFENEASIKTFFEKLTVKRGGKTESKTDYSPVKGDIVQN